MKSNNFLFVIDNGHGGVINGVPQTAGKRSPDFGDGVLYEGVSNRRIAAKVIEGLREACLNVRELVPELEDISLRTRANRVNALARYNNVILISIHSDAFHKESARGWSAWTYYGDTKSDKVATVLYKHAKKARLKVREDWSDGDPDKEANFYILRRTNCAAVLVENLFMTNEKDYKTLKSEKGQDKLAKVIIESCKEIAQNGL